MLYGGASAAGHEQGGCDDCGTYSFNLDAHTCDEKQRVDHQARQILPSFSVFETAYRDWLVSPHGQFAQLEAGRSTPA